MKTLIQTFLFFFFLNSVFAQQGHFCQTDQAPIMERLIQNKEFLKTQGLPQRKTDYYIPVVFHLIADAAGNFRAEEKDVFNLLCRVNENFKDVGFVFYSKESPLKIDNQSLSEDFINGVNGNIHNSFLRDSAINIFVVKQNGFNNTIWQGIAQPEFAWIAIENDVAKETSHYLSHELGHFFSLPHTSHGWGRNPLIGVTKVPEIDQLGQPTEYQDGTNCDVGGDRICDTPPDYFAFFPSGCNYDGGIMDPSSTPIDPMENNMMSGFFDCANYEFTPNQFEVIEADYLSTEKDYLRTNFTPMAIGIPSRPQLISPIGGASFGVNRLVFFDWEDVDSVSNYIFEISTTQSFITIEQTIITTTSEVFVDNLAHAQNYYWRVTSISRTGCSQTSDTIMIQTDYASNTNKIELKSNILKIYPNPTKGAFINGEFNTKQTQEALIEIFQSDGKRVYTQTHNFQNGINTFSIPTKNLSAGISILKIKTPNGTLVEKVFIK